MYKYTQIRPNHYNLQSKVDWRVTISVLVKHTPCCLKRAYNIQNDTSRRLQPGQHSNSNNILHQQPICHFCLHKSLVYFVLMSMYEIVLRFHDPNVWNQVKLGFHIWDNTPSSWTCLSKSRILFIIFKTRLILLSWYQWRRLT